VVYIVNWFELLLHLENITKKDYALDRSTLYGMYLVTKNTSDKWDGQVYTVKQIKKTFGRVLDLVYSNKGQVINYDYEDHDYDKQEIFQMIFNTHDRLRWSQYEPVVARAKLRMTDDRRGAIYCNKCSKPDGILQEVGLCKDCRLKAHDEVYIKKNLDNKEYNRQVYSFIFTHHVIAGVLCTDNFA
jgi:ribosomal protein S14